MRRSAREDESPHFAVGLYKLRLWRVRLPEPDVDLDLPPVYRGRDFDVCVASRDAFEPVVETRVENRQRRAPPGVVLQVPVT